MRIAEAPRPSRPEGPRPPSPRPAPPAKPFTAVLAERTGPAAKAFVPPNPAEKPGAPTTSARGQGTGQPPVRAMLERLDGAESRVDALLNAAAKGKTFSPAELIALQADVFRYSQTVEVVSRVADRLVAAIKQTLGTNV